METSKVARTELARLIRSEIQNQIEGLGLATKRDLERLDRRVARLETERKKAPATTGPRKKTTAGKSTAKKSTAKKSTAKSTAKGQGTSTSGNATSRPSSLS
jgi:activator of HSP90 ATPase